MVMSYTKEPSKVSNSYLICDSMRACVCVWNFGEESSCFDGIYSRVKSTHARLCCSVLQCVAVCCSVLLYLLRSLVGTRSIVFQCVAVCCSVLQCIAMCCSTCSGVKSTKDRMCCSMLQYIVVCCSVLQCVAVCCSVLQYLLRSQCNKRSNMRPFCTACQD